MNIYQVVTQCGVFVRVDAVNSYQAANQARDEGWQVVGVYRIK